MTVFRWQPPPLSPSTEGWRPAFAVLALALSLPLPALAQTPSAALVASDPATPSTPPALMALPAPEPAAAPERPTDIDAARAIWQRANQRVAEFPRGHVDLLRWEVQNPARPSIETGETGLNTPELDMAVALRQSLRHRPGLFTHAGMNDLERATVQRAYAEHVRALQRAWIDAVSARQRLRLMGESLEAAATGAELGRRMVQAGNWSQARLLREQLTEAQAQQAWTRAAQAQQAATEQLARLLGMWDAQAVGQLTQRLPAQLPEPPAQLSTGAAEVEAVVLRSQPLLAQQRLRAQRALVAVSPERRAVWSQAVDEALKTPATPTAATPWLAPQIGDLRLVRDHSLEAAVEAESALLMAASERRSMAREAWRQLHAQHTGALQTQHALRLQTAQEQETLLRYNGMLQSSWDLLASAGERLGALDAAMMARRDFWLAQADWDALLAGADVEPASPGASSDNNKRAAAGGH
ncbi:MAG: hypothetical protein U1C47_01735 [Hydrogenophaga sp.]|nr:hypothetical protein [Hydrogenophaga sp.]